MIRVKLFPDRCLLISTLCLFYQNDPCKVVPRQVFAYYIFAYFIRMIRVMLFPDRCLLISSLCLFNQNDPCKVVPRQVFAYYNLMFISSE